MGMVTDYVSVAAVATYLVTDFAASMYQHYANMPGKKMISFGPCTAAGKLLTWYAESRFGPRV